MTNPCPALSREAALAAVAPHEAEPSADPVALTADVAALRQLEATLQATVTATPQAFPAWQLAAADVLVQGLLARIDAAWGEGGHTGARAEVRAAVARLRHHKASGPDRMSPTLFKAAINPSKDDDALRPAAEALTRLYNAVDHAGSRCHGRCGCGWQGHARR